MANFIKYLALSLLLCICCNQAMGQQKKKGSGNKEEKIEYPRKASIWQLDEDYSIKEYSVEQDTSLHLFQVYDKNDKQSISVSNLGNMGSPCISNIFDDRMQAKKSPVYFLDCLSDNIFRPEDTKFYQVNHPYTWLYYSCTPKARNGQIVDFTHTQNVCKKINWGFNIGLVGSTGRYSHQHTRNVSFVPQMSYIGKHLQVHFFYNFNKMSVEENGGIIDTVEIRNNRFTTRLEKPFSNWGYRTWNLVGEYSVGKTDFNIINDTTRTEVYTPRLAVGYALQFSKVFRTYEDSEVGRKFYDNYYRKEASTFDSLFYHCLSNRFHIKICENQYTPEIKGAIGMENELYYNLIDTSACISENRTNTFLEGAISKNKTKSLILGGRLRQYISGYKEGDIRASASLGFKIFKGQSDTLQYQMKASLNYSNERPTFFEQTYYSNNYRWDNSLSKTETWRLGGQIDMPRWGLSAGGAFYHVRDLVFFNAKAMPEQMSDLSIMSLSLSHDLKAGPLRMATRATIQTSLDEQQKRMDTLCLPKLAIYHSTYLQFYLVKNVLLTQLGGEVRYSGEFNALAYSPATSTFYQGTRVKDGQIVKAGHYPIISGFANIKIHGVLMFFKWEHIDGGWIRDWYAPTDCYPMQDFHFMFGLLWRFGD